MRKWRVLIALALVSALLSGCLFQTGQRKVTAFPDMEYSRPDLTAMEMTLVAIEDSLAAGQEITKVMDNIYDFYEWYYDFYTQYALANIHYFIDMTDIYWEKEYNFCLENSTAVDAALDQLLYDLADSGRTDELEAEEYFGADFFDDYEGESLWDDTFTALAQEEAELQALFYELSNQIPDTLTESFYQNVGAKLAQLYVDLVKVRQEMALYAGYEDFADFAYEFYHERDYTPEQAVAYLEDIQKELAPLYRQQNVNELQRLNSQASSETQTFAYVKTCAENMGGTIRSAFQLLEKAKLYHISEGEHKYENSFEMYIFNYDEPFVFLNPEGRIRDQLTFAHEFGHFCNDYVSYGSGVSVDVAEVFSQGMEFLSLYYGSDTEDLAVLKMNDSLRTFVEQSAYASFEHQVYSLSTEELTVENVTELFETVCNSYGFDIWDWDSRNFMLIPHFFVRPMYVISYVISNDAALQLYQREAAEAGAGLKLLEENLATENATFLAFVEGAGLENPFTEGRAAAIRKTLEQIL